MDRNLLTSIVLLSEDPTAAFRVSLMAISRILPPFLLLLRYMTYATTITASIVLRSVLSTVAEYLPGVILEYASPRTCGYFGTQIGTGIFSYFALKKSWGRKASPLVSPGERISGLL
jgi:hypothetical protein